MQYSKYSIWVKGLKNVLKNLVLNKIIMQQKSMENYPACKEQQYNGHEDTD